MVVVVVVVPVSAAAAAAAVAADVGTPAYQQLRSIVLQAVKLCWQSFQKQVVARFQAWSVSAVVVSPLAHDPRLLPRIVEYCRQLGRVATILAPDHT